MKALLQVTLLLIAISALQNCSPTHTSPSVPEDTKVLSFLPEHNETELWTESDKYPQTPYIMWLASEGDTPCTVPIYRTGYQTSWTFVRSLAQDNGIQTTELGACENLSDRCYLKSTDWLGVGIKEDGFHEAKACDPELEGPK